jgi:uncharacterized protein with von Willebrand factor type A (vWA) domain
MNENHSFDRTEYSDPDINHADAHQIIRQITVDMVHDVPTVGMWTSMTGNQLKIHYHDYVMNLPVHLKETVERSETAFKELVKYLKNEFKRRAGKTLTLKEDKDLHNYTVEKVSLNERYYYRAWRVYDVSF